MKAWLVYPLLLALLSGCLSDEIVGSGTLAVREYALAPFVNVVMDSSIGRLYIEQGDSYSLRVDADDNLIDRFVSDVENKTLTIKMEQTKKVIVKHPVKIYVKMKQIESIALNGNGTAQSYGVLQVEGLIVKVSGSGMISLDIKGKSLDVNIAGSGGVVIKGEVQEQTANVSGSGSYHAQDLHTKDSKLTLNGSGSALISVDDKLTVNLFGAGSVRYKGHPKLQETIEGTGTIQALD